MHRHLKTCFFLILGLLLSTEAFAQPGSRGQGRSGQNRQGMMQRLPVLAALDKDKDGTISKDEIADASESLLTLDKDENGKLDSAEMLPGGGFGGGRGQRGGKGGKGGGGKSGKGGGGKGGSGVSAKVFDFLAEKYDKDGDKKISPQEHDRGEELFARLDKDKDGFLTSKDWEIETPRGKRTGSDQTAPEVGAVAPDFELTLVDDEKKTLKLSSFAGEKPVALIFGSCS